MIENSLKAHVHPGAHSYISTILNPSNRTDKTYVPCRMLTPEDTSDRDQILQQILGLTDGSYGGINALNYLLYELTNNIYEHSEFDKAFIMAQRYPKKDLLKYVSLIMVYQFLAILQSMDFLVKMILMLLIKQ